MNNAESPAVPVKDESDLYGQHYGLTKREHFCLHMGVPETGDEELDDIIRKGNELKYNYYGAT